MVPVPPSFPEASYADLQPDDGATAEGGAPPGAGPGRPASASSAAPPSSSSRTEWAWRPSAGPGPGQQGDARAPGHWDLVPGEPPPGASLKVSMNDWDMGEEMVTAYFIQKARLGWEEEGEERGAPCRPGSNFGGLPLSPTRAALWPCRIPLSLTARSGETRFLCVAFSRWTATARRTSGSTASSSWSRRARRRGRGESREFSPEGAEREGE